MRRRIRGLGFLALLLGIVTLGCQKPLVQHKTPPDPLLVSKKPMEGKPTTGEPVTTAQIEPLPPPLPRIDQAPSLERPLAPPSRQVGYDPTIYRGQ